jgi:hypothetical protein
VNLLASERDPDPYKAPVERPITAKPLSRKRHKAFCGKLIQPALLKNPLSGWTSPPGTPVKIDKIKRLGAE